MGGLLGRQVAGHRLELVHAVEREEATDRQRLGRRVPLVVIEVGEVGRRHDDVVPLPGRLDPSLDATP